MLLCSTKPTIESYHVVVTMSDEEPDLVEDAVSKKELIIARNATDVQKMRLDKLMENPVQ